MLVTLLTSLTRRGWFGGGGKQTVNFIVAEVSRRLLLRESPHLLTNEAVNAIGTDEYISGEPPTITSGDLYARGALISKYDTCVYVE